MEQEREEWRPVVGWEEHYEVSNTGQIRKLADGHICHQRMQQSGVVVKLRDKQRPPSTHSVAKIVATAFIEKPGDGRFIVIHKNGDYSNNHPANLYWVPAGTFLNTEESHRKAAATMKTPEVHAKLVARWKERWNTPSGRALLLKIAEKAWEKTRRKVICLETGIIYPTALLAAKAYGLSKGAVSTSCQHKARGNGRLMSRDGKPVFHFRYYNPEDWKPKERIWKPVPVQAVASKYEVSNMGEVRRTRDKHPLVPVFDKHTRYRRVSFFVNGSVHGFSVHKLVADAFLPKQYGMDCVGHRDGDRSNNCVTNLYWTNMRSTYRSPINKANYAGGRKPRPVVCIETGVVYKSLAETARVCQITARSVAQACARYAAGTALYEKHTFKGRPVYHFRYADQ